VSRTVVPSPGTLENSDAPASGLAQFFDREQPHVGKHDVHCGPQVMSNGVEVHDSTSQIQGSADRMG
jgi:hypothetical protein